MSNETKPRKRASIQLNGDFVELRATCPYTGEPIEWNFVAYGMYIRDADTEKQVCVGLDRIGETLTATSREDMLKKIRKHWRKYRSTARKLCAPC